MKKIAKVGFLAVSCVLLIVPCIVHADVYCPPLNVISDTGPTVIACNVVNYKAGASPDVVTITVFNNLGQFDTAVLPLVSYQFGEAAIQNWYDPMIVYAGCVVKGGGSDLRVSLEVYDFFTGKAISQIVCPPAQ